MDCGSDRIGRDLKKLFGQTDKLVDRQRAMPLIGRGLKRERYTGPKPLRRLLGKAEPHRDRVGAAEADTADIASKAVRVFRHDRDRLMAIGLENSHRSRCADAVAV